MSPPSGPIIYYMYSGQDYIQQTETLLDPEYIS